MALCPLKATARSANIEYKCSFVNAGSYSHFSHCVFLLAGLEDAGSAKHFFKDLAAANESQVIQNSHNSQLLASNVQACNFALIRAHKQLIVVLVATAKAHNA
jgi:hypothetical protein